MIKCPNCGSGEVYALVKLSTVVKVNTGEFENGPIERYEDGLFEEFNCDRCDHFWLPNY